MKIIFCPKSTINLLCNIVKAFDLSELLQTRQIWKVVKLEQYGF